MLCCRDRATGEGVEMFDEAAEAMAYEGYDEEISTHSAQCKHRMGRQSTSSATKSKKLPSQQYFEKFELIQDLRDDEKEEWIRFLLDN
ncbi:hypothetical protein LIER_21694 [Lithospermum erythrorhizon]|uniref:Uncharacterized protein n=1 Tax=Lithospermum erythrorhizon TaxID=34254 RepID=A0AAV3QSD1_LITER